MSEVEELFQKLIKIAKWYARLKEEERSNLDEELKWRIKLLEKALKIDLLELGKRLLIQEQAR